MIARLSLLALTLLSSAGCAVLANPGEDHACSVMACADGLDVDFTFKDKGSYVVDLTIDGVKTRCTATLPLPASPPAPCDRPGVYLTLSGSMLPADQQSIGGLHVTAVTARHVTLRITRDGAELGALDRDVSWVVTPGPNGPDCEPKECRRAQLTL